MFRKPQRPSPGPKWEAIKEPEPSSDDELDTEDGEADTLLQSSSPTQTRLNVKRARDGDNRMETTQDPPQSAPPAFASTSTNVMGDNPRSQLKRKEFESLFASKKRVRYVQASCSDQDNAMDLDLDKHAKNKGNMGANSGSAPVPKTMGRLGGRQSGVSSSVSSIMMEISDDSPISPPTSTVARPDLPRKKSAMNLPPFRPKRPSESAAAESSQSATRDHPSKLAGLPFDTYKSKTLPSSDPGRSNVPASPLDKAPLKHSRIPPAPQPTRHPSTQKTKVIPPDAEVIEISEDDSSPSPISKAKAKSIRPSSIKTLGASEQARQASSARKTVARKIVASSSVPSPATKKFLPKVPIEIIEILDSDEEQLPTKVQLEQQNNVGTSSGSRLSEPVQECATGSNARKGQSPPLSWSSFEGSDGDRDEMNVDETRNLLQPASPVPSVGSVHSVASDSDSYPDNVFDIPPSPRASSQEIQATDYTSDNPAAQGLIPLPSSSPSSIGMSPPKDSYLSTAPAPMTTASPKSPLSWQSSTSTANPNYAGKSISTSANASSSNNRLGFSSVAVPPSLQTPSPVKRHLIQLARKTAIPQPMSDEDEDSATSKPSERAGTWTRANKGKEKEIRRSSTSSSGAESIHMRVLRDTLTLDSDKSVRQHLVSSIRPTNGGQTLAEAIISAGQLNRTKKKTRRHLRGTTKDVPIDLTSDVEGSVKDGPTVDEDEKALKAAIGSSRLLVNLLPTLKAKSSAGPSVIAAAAAVKVTEPPSSKIERSSSYPLSTLSPERNVMARDMPSQKPPPSPLAEVQPNLEPTGLSEETRESDGDVPMADVSSRNSISPMSANVFAAPPSAAIVMAPSSIPLPLSPSQPALVNSSSSTPVKLPNRLISPKRTPLTMTETSFIANISSRQTRSPGKQLSLAAVDMQPLLATTVAGQSITIAHSSGGEENGVALLDVPTDDSRDEEEEECQALLQVSSDDMDIVPSHDTRPSLQDSILVRNGARNSFETSVALSSASTPISSDDMDNIVPSHDMRPSSQDDIVDAAQKIFDTSSSALTAISAATEIFNEQIHDSTLIPEEPAHRSSRMSSRSSTSEGLGTAFEDDFGPFDAVPATRTPTPEEREPSTSTSPGGSKIYGGFRALTWKNFRQDLTNFTPKVHYAKDLPHALQDHINSMSEYTQMLEGMRNLFKATILENTVEDEPDAPPIEVWNGVDTQPTPPWEFFYTNHMWLGEGVPPPDIKNLVSCNCKGGCNPKSKTCACLLRQREAAGDPQLEFAYDKNGKLKIPGYPIFECNDLCGCSDECRNRVVQHGRKVSVNIAKTETKGWGVFAGAKKIPEGTYIGIYSGELLTDDVAHERGVKYNKFGRTYLFDIDFHHLKEPDDHNWESRFTVDAYHAGNFTRFLNHSCDPNCRLYACYINEGNIQKPLLAIFSRRDIEPFEEICFNYQGSYPDNDDSDDSDDDIEIIDPDIVKDIIYCPCRCGAKNCTGKMFK